MAFSNDVVDGTDATASEYNELRKDTLDNAAGHTHTGAANGGKLVTHLSTGVEFGSVVTRYLAISPASFVPRTELNTWTINGGIAQANSVASLLLVAPVNLPHNAFVTSFKVYWYRDDASAAGYCSLRQSDFVNNNVEMAVADSNSSAGYHSVEDTTINQATIANNGFTYAILLEITPNDNILDVWFTGAVITYTIIKPLP